MTDITEIKTIFSEKLIIVEGRSDERFIFAILNKLDIQDIQIINIKGRDFTKYLPAIGKVPGFDLVKILVLIGDANNDSNAAFTRIKDSIGRVEEYEFNPPSQKNQFNNDTDFPRIGIFLFSKPGSQEGILEDLCLATVENDPIMDCVNEFHDCITGLGCELKNPPKSKCLTYLSAMKELKTCIGIAAQKGYWDLDSNVLNDLTDFLRFLKSS